MKRIRRRATSGRKTRDSLIRPWSRRICLSLSPVIAGRPGSDNPAGVILQARAWAGMRNCKIAPGHVMLGRLIQLNVQTAIVPIV